MVLYDENSVCPKCGNELHLQLLKRLRLKIFCKKCRFKTYPRVEQISESLKQRYLRDHLLG